LAAIGHRPQQRYDGQMQRLILGLTVSLSLIVAGPALAWGNLGHEVTALIAYRHLTPMARAKVDAMLASDHDTLTAPDFASRATWADAYRQSHRETAPWHFVDIEVDNPDLSAACFGFPMLMPGQLASQGPVNDCIVDKLNEFEAELADPATPTAERLMALKFVMHFAGDIEQPLHAADHHDRGGNCIALSRSPDGYVTNLHAFWDVTAVKSLGPSAQVIATRLEAQTTPEETATWSKGAPKDWAMETSHVAQADAYQGLASEPTCAERGSISLSPAYQAQASKIAALQLERAGIRMAALINRATEGYLVAPREPLH
jgi:hypothetical protein